MKKIAAMEQHAVAIIGIGCTFAQSPDLKGFLKVLMRGINAVSDPPDTHRHLRDYLDPDPKRADHIYCNRGGFLPRLDFDPSEFGIPPSAIEATDTSQLLGLVVAKQALADAGYGDGGQSFDRERTSVILGVTGTQELVIPLGARLGHPIWRRALDEAGVPPAAADRVMQSISDSYVGWQENSFPGLLGNVVAGRIANRLDLGGTNCVVDAACASSMSALHLALMELTGERADMVLAGGVDTINDAFMHMCFSKSQILSPSGEIRPFSQDADGTLLGEGIGMVVLKRLADARRDGNRIYAVIKGLGSASDGKSQSIYAPRAAGQASALARAYHHAGVDPATVQMVEAHGTGTRVGDQVEFEALCEVFRKDQADNGNHCALGSVKSNIGHTKAAAGTAGLIKTALALYHKILPPTLKAMPTDTKLGVANSPFYINHALRPWTAPKSHKRRAGVSAFGFGGSNFHAVLEEHDALKSEPAWDGSVQIAAFSGEDRTQVARQLEAFSQAAADASTAVDLALAAAHSRNVFRVDHAWRLALVLTPADDLPAARRQCERAAECLAGETAAVTTDPPIFIGHGTPAGGLAFLFPGQGSQYVGMGRDLICCFPGSLAAFEAAAHHFDAPLPLSDYLYPRMRGDSADHDVRLRATDIAQPAIGAVSTAMLEALTYFGVVPNAVCGHSFGELTALHAAGCISREALWQLSQIRGRLMAATGANGRDPGAMLAVQAPLEELAAVLESRCPEVVLANRNSPRQAVLSGPTDAIGAAEVVCREKSWNSMRLPVAAAFHSPLVADAREPLVQALAQIDWQPGTLPVLSNTTGTAYPSDPAAAMALWAGQLARPVDFVANLKQLYTDGIRTFVEVGPKAVLSRFVHDTLGPTNSAALAVDRSAGRRAGIADLACLLAELVALGHRVHLERWETPVFQPRMPRMRIPLSGANYRSSRLPKTALTDQVPLRTADVSTASRQAAAIVPPTAQPSESLPLSPAAAMTTGIKPPGPTGQGKNSDMNTPKPPSQVDHALAAVQQGLSAFQALQTQTTQAHQKYLDTQAEAHRTLRQMLQSTQQMTSVLLGQDPPAPAPTAQSSTDPESYKAMAPLPSATPFSDSIPKIQTETRETPPMPPAIASSEPQTPDAASSETVRQTLLTVVSQLTGYPEEMLGLQMDIEADLGIDSIKRVEILSALEERMPHLPKVTPDLVGTLTTLGHICDFLSQGRAPSPTPAHTTAPETPVVESSPGNGMGRFVIRLTTPIALSDTALPFTPAPDHFIGVVSEDAAWAQHVAAAFTRRGYASRPLSTPETITTDGTAMAGLMLLAPLASSTAFEWAQAAASSLKHGSSKGHALLCTVTRLDGGFGFTGKPVDHPEQGALAGLSKTAALEWDKIRCRAVDLSPDWPDEVAAEALAREIADYHATDDLEIGLSAEGRLTPRMTAEALSESIGPLQLSENDVVVVTGGARGVTAEAVAALARRTRCRLALLGRSPLPESEPDWLAGLQGEAHIKQAILKHDFNGSASSPRALAIACQRRMADRDILATLSGLQQAGLQVAYHAVDVRDAEAVRMTVERIRQEWGAVKAMIHGAGVLADHLLVDKQKHQFIEVYETKISGLASLLSATQQDPLRYVVLFSSIAARTGNPGQCDYAMANEALNKIGTQYALDHPQCKVLAINWGPWDGGMVTPSLKRVLEKRGVDLIPIAQGAAAMVAEMAQPAGGPVEIVIGGPLGMPALTDTQPTAEAVETQAEPAAMTQAAQRDIDATQCPVLQDHQLDGRPVVPFALMAEWLAHGALHANPGLRLHGIDELRLLNGIIFDHHQRRIQLMAGATARIGELFEVAVQIRDANGNGTSRIHSSAKAILADRLPPAPEFHENGHFNPSPNLRPLAEIYETVLFHGETLHGIKEIIRIGEQGITAHLQAAPSPDQWLTEPLRSRWIADPLVLDCAFQMAVIWCHEQRGQVCLPIYAAAYRQYRERFPAEGCTAVLEVIQTDAHKLTADITFLDQARKVIAVMKGYEAVIDQQLFKAFRVKAA